LAIKGYNSSATAARRVIETLILKLSREAAPKAVPSNIAGRRYHCQWLQVRAIPFRPLNLLLARWHATLRGPIPVL
jgi:hypothetical protein